MLAESSFEFDQANRLTRSTTPTEQALEGRYQAPATSVRVLDTRAATRAGLCPTVTASCVTIPAGAAMTVQIAGQGGVPTEGINAVSLNVTAVNPTGVGSLSVYPAGATPVSTANVSFTTAGQAVSNTVLAALSADGQITIAAANSATDVTVDVDGWYGDNTLPGGTFSTLAPARLIDTANSGP